MIGVLNRLDYDLVEGVGVPIPSKYFHFIAGESSPEEALEDLKFLEKKGYVTIEHNPINTTEDTIGKLLAPIPQPWTLRERTTTRDKGKQKMLDGAFEDLPERGENYSNTIQVEILRGVLNDSFSSGHKIKQKWIQMFIKNKEDWSFFMSALKKWKSQGYLKILKDPQTASEDEDCIEILKPMDL